MSDLPARDSLNTYTIEDWLAKQDVLAAYKYGVLKSRDEMNEEAVLPHMTVSEMLDAAWGVADE